ncbi:NUDIX hydrolase [Clostridium massiliamazoniense]|uniref:NUDIX hydrolase n=1 Tax=Clostridium massiliamazoniense TaxID=1347366 RepID=UPI0006D81F6D|nr:NUDIX hydrolase [Clostridium massiliamazoniense]
MNLKNIILNYKPFNEQEEADKNLILEALDKFSDLLSRENNIAHFTSSTFVVNKNRDKVLMVYHNIYDSWSWIGGHCDGDGDFKRVAIKELEEETGVKDIEFVNEEIFALDVLPVKSHIKRGKFISSHLHLSVAYVVEASEKEDLRVKLDENSAVKWIDINKLLNFTEKEPHMQVVYSKLIKKLNNMK